MDIHVSSSPSATVVALAGRLDGLASPALEQRVQALVDGGASRLVFDCEKLAYASSAGLRVFLSSAKKCKAAGGKAVFAALTPGVREVFELSGFLGVFEVYPSVADATAALG